MEEQLKLKHFNQDNSNIYRGFFPFLPNDPSHKEFFDQGRPNSEIPESERKKWPMYEEAPWFKDDPEGKYKWI